MQSTQMHMPSCVVVVVVVCLGVCLGVCLRVLGVVAVKGGRKAFARDTTHLCVPSSRHDRKGSTSTKRRSTGIGIVGGAILVRLETTANRCRLRHSVENILFGAAREKEAQAPTPLRLFTCCVIGCAASIVLVVVWNIWNRLEPSV